MTDAEMFAEVKERYLDGQDAAEIARSLQLTERLINKYLTRVRVAVTVEDFELPPGVQEQVTLATLNKVMLKCGDSNDPKANRVAIEAVEQIHKHPLVVGQRRASEPNWSRIGQIGGNVSLEGLLDAPAPEPQPPQEEPEDS